MTSETSKAIKCLNQKDYAAFKIILSSSHDTIEFSIIDNYLLGDRSINYMEKIDYIQKYNRKELLNSLIEDLKNNYDKYDYYTILYFANNYIKSTKKRIFYLLESFAKADLNSMEYFHDMLIYNSLYKEFVTALMNTTGSSIKLKAGVFLDTKLILELYKDNISFIKAICDSNLSSKEKIEYLVELSARADLDNNDLKVIKEAIITIAESYKEKMDTDLATYDQELVDYNHELYVRDMKETFKKIDVRKEKSYLHK